MSENFDDKIVEIDIDLDNERDNDSAGDYHVENLKNSDDNAHITTDPDVDDLLRAKDEFIKAAGDLKGKLGSFALKKGDEFFGKLSQSSKQKAENRDTTNNIEPTVYEYQSESKSHRSGKTYKIKTTHSSSKVMPNKGEIDVHPNSGSNDSHRGVTKVSTNDSHHKVGCGGVLAIVFLVMVIILNLPSHRTNDSNLPNSSTDENVSVEMQEEYSEESTGTMDEVDSDKESERETEEDALDAEEPVAESEKNAEEDSASKKPKKSYKLTLKVNYSSAGLFASYDIDVFVDDKKIGNVSPEEKLSKKIKIEEGKHIIRFSETDSGSSEETTEIELKGNRIYSCDLESHFTSIDIVNEHLEKKKDREARLAEEAEERKKEQNKNALRTAESYLESSAFSKKGLKEQLIFEGYSEDEAKYAVNHCDADWKEQALKHAKSYLDSSTFSKKGLKEQLLFEGYTEDEAQYGVKHCGADWKEQALEQAKSYQEIFSFSKSELKEQLLFEGYTEDEAKYAVNKVF